VANPELAPRSAFHGVAMMVPLSHGCTHSFLPFIFFPGHLFLIVVVCGAI
jgi:hypothetical protein